MKTAVVYFSLGGATRSFARAEANARGADLFEAVPEKKYNPFSALVRGCHAAMRQKSVPLSEAPDLPRGAEVEALLVSASGSSEKSRAKVRALLEARGCRVVAQRDIRSHR